MVLALNYRTVGAWGTGLGRRLTSAEVDGNFWAIAQAIDTFTADDPVSISSISQSGNSITFHLTDTTTQGPFVLPIVSLTPRGDWTTATDYDYRDIVRDSVTGNLYLVLLPHTSSGTAMNPALTISGSPAFSLLVDAEEIAIAAAALVPPADPGPAFVQPTGEGEWITGTTYTLSAAVDSFKMLLFANSTGLMTVTVPDDATETSWEQGTVIALRQDNDYPVKVVAGGSAYVDPPEISNDVDLKTAFKGAVIWLMKTDGDYWIAWGDLARNVNYTPSASTVVTRSGNGIYYRNTSSSNRNLTVPPDSTGKFTENFVCHAVQLGSGYWEIVPGSGVTLNSYDVTAIGAIRTRAQGSAITLVRVSEDVWDVIGDIDT